MDELSFSISFCCPGSDGVLYPATRGPTEQGSDRPDATGLRTLALSQGECQRPPRLYTAIRPSRGSPPPWPALSEKGPLFGSLMSTPPLMPPALVLGGSENALSVANLDV